MAFITRANANSIRQNIDLSKAGNIPTENIYESDLKILSENELRWLAAARMLYEDFDFFINYVYAKKKPIDTKTLVYEGGFPAYHSDSSCKKLRADYQNFLIPVEIQGKGDAEITRFRKWFSDNKDLIKENSDKFLIKMEVAFSLKNPPKIEELEALNSGVEREENINLDDIQANIDSHIVKCEKFRNLPDNLWIIKKYGNISYKKTGDGKKDSVIGEWHNLKNELKTKLLVYFRVKFNPELKFHSSLLEQLGFRGCSSCQKIAFREDR